MFLCGPAAYCYHEPTADFTPSEWVSDARSRPEEVVGAIDTAAHRYSYLVDRACPDARCFVLLRDPAEISQSLDYAGMHGMDIADAYAKLAALPHERIFHRNFSSPQYLHDLWGMLNESECDSAHVARFMELRIQRDPKLFMAQRPNLHTHVRGMLS